MAGGESKSGSNESRKITPRLRSNLAGCGGAEHVIKDYKETRTRARGTEQLAAILDRLEGAEMGLETMGERRRFAMFNAPEQVCQTQVVTDLGLIRPRGSRPRPNRAYGTKVKSEKAHIEAEGDA
uniref:Uncharacterized protein n=1 Tax=Fagus sylvatica TaxID=28930 RepID=A0A2N9GRG0_FAGSY